MPARPSRGARLAVSLLMLAALATPASGAERLTVRSFVPREPVAASAQFVAGELLVRFAPGVPSGARAQLVTSQAGWAARRLRLPDTVLVQLPEGANVPAAAAALTRRPEVLWAEPNYIYPIFATPDDPRLGDLWALDSGSDHDIDAPAAWDVTTGSTDVVVAVVDTGVDHEHPDLADNVWHNPDETLNGVDDDGNGLIDDVRGWDFVGGDSDPMDENGHGSHVAGIIGARGNNGSGITGVAWQVSVMPLRAADESGNLTNGDIADAFDYACSEGARVVNASFGGPQFSNAVRNAIQGCPGALFVVAAGNGGNDGAGDNNDATPAYPCAYTLANIVCVAATGRNDRLTSFSNFGVTSVDIAAPGQSILSATPNRVFMADGFEAGLNGWAANKDSGETWSSTSEAAWNGSQSATDSAGGNYLNGSNTWIETASPLDLTGGSDCQLDYAFRIDLEEGADWLLVEGSDDGGSQWTVIDSGAPGNLAWTGSTSGAFVEFTEFIGEDGFDGVASLDVRFRLESDGSIRRDGAWIDDVAVHCQTGTHGTDDFVRLSGTSMATPYVAGVAALLLAEYPLTPTADLKAALLDGSDPVAALAGKVASGGRLNARGALDALDPVRPIASAPSHRLVASSTLGSASVPLRISWDAATDAEPSSGISEYQLQQRAELGGTWRSWVTLARTSKLAFTAKVTPGTHQFRVRAQDGAGNWSTWKAGGQLVLKDPQGGSAITFRRTWSTQSGTGFFDGSTRHAAAPRSAATHAFTGEQVAWVASRGPNRGRAQVYVDGALAATINLYAPSLQHRRVVFLKTWSAAASHSIKVKVISKSSQSSGRRVDLDAFITLR